LTAPVVRGNMVFSADLISQLAGAL